MKKKLSLCPFLFSGFFLSFWPTYAPSSFQKSFLLTEEEVFNEKKKRFLESILEQDKTIKDDKRKKDIFSMFDAKEDPIRIEKSKDLNAKKLEEYEKQYKIYKKNKPKILSPDYAKESFDKEKNNLKKKLYQLQFPKQEKNRVEVIENISKHYSTEYHNVFSFLLSSGLHSPEVMNLFSFYSFEFLRIFYEKYEEENKKYPEKDLLLYGFKYKDFNKGLTRKKGEWTDDFVKQKIGYYEGTHDVKNISKKIPTNDSKESLFETDSKESLFETDSKESQLKKFDTQVKKYNEDSLFLEKWVINFLHYKLRPIKENITLKDVDCFFKNNEDIFKFSFDRIKNNLKYEKFFQKEIALFGKKRLKNTYSVPIDINKIKIIEEILDNAVYVKNIPEDFCADINSVEIKEGHKKMRVLKQTIIRNLVYFIEDKEINNDFEEKGIDKFSINYFLKKYIKKIYIEKEIKLFFLEFSFLQKPKFLTYDSITIFDDNSHDDNIEFLKKYFKNRLIFNFSNDIGQNLEPVQSQSISRWFIEMDPLVIRYIENLILENFWTEVFHILYRLAFPFHDISQVLYDDCFVEDLINKKKRYTNEKRIINSRYFNKDILLRLRDFLDKKSTEKNIFNFFQNPYSSNYVSMKNAPWIYKERMMIFLIEQNVYLEFISILLDIPINIIFAFAKYTLCYNLINYNDNLKNLTYLKIFYDFTLPNHGVKKFQHYLDKGSLSYSFYEKKELSYFYKPYQGPYDITEDKSRYDDLKKRNIHQEWLYWNDGFFYNEDFEEILGKKYQPWYEFLFFDKENEAHKNHPLVIYEKYFMKKINLELISFFKFLVKKLLIVNKVFNNFYNQLKNFMDYCNTKSRESEQNDKFTPFLHAIKRELYYLSIILDKYYNTENDDLSDYNFPLKKETELYKKNPFFYDDKAFYEQSSSFTQDKNITQNVQKNFTTVLSALSDLEEIYCFIRASKQERINNPRKTFPFYCNQSNIEVLKTSADIDIFIHKFFNLSKNIDEVKVFTNSITSFYDFVRNIDGGQIIDTFYDSAIILSSDLKNIALKDYNNLTSLDPLFQDIDNAFQKFFLHFNFFFQKNKDILDFINERIHLKSQFGSFSEDEAISSYVYHIKFSKNIENMNVEKDINVYKEKAVRSVDYFKNSIFPLPLSNGD